MDYILDTHALIWFLDDNAKLGSDAKPEIENAKNRCFVSIASFWEISIKVSLQKLGLKREFFRLFDYCHELDFKILPILPAHLQQLLHMESHHKDPFDRLIIAQAQIEKMDIITKDENFRKYSGVQVLW